MTTKILAQNMTTFSLLVRKPTEGHNKFEYKSISMAPKSEKTQSHSVEQTKVNWNVGPRSTRPSSKGEQQEFLLSPEYGKKILGIPTGASGIYQNQSGTVPSSKANNLSAGLVENLCSSCGCQSKSGDHHTLIKLQPVNNSTAAPWLTVTDNNIYNTYATVMAIVKFSAQATSLLILLSRPWSGAVSVATPVSSEETAERGETNQEQHKARPKGTECISLQNKLSLTLHGHQKGICGSSRRSTSLNYFSTFRNFFFN